ncbi:MAG: hypothetical protein ACF8Q5_10300 [Phycisphaerales bacterium JB040]
MKNQKSSTRTRIASVLTTTILSLAWLAQPQAAAGIATFDRPAPSPSWASDLTALTLGQSVTELAFNSNLESFAASVSTDSATNQITGEGVWRLQGGATTLGFDAPLGSLWFSYRHQNRGAVRLGFFDAAGVSLDGVTLDGQDARSGTVLYEAGGSGFSSVSITWLRAEGQWFELGPELRATPALAPAPASLGLLGLSLVGARRRRA